MRFHWMHKLLRLGATSSRRGRRRPSCRPAVERLEDRTLPAILTVTTIADSGLGSLRQAITDANNMAGADTIAFNIPGSGVRTIRPTSILPGLTSPIVVDGTTQPGFSGTPLIEVSGVNAGTTQVDGFRVFSGLPLGGPCTIKGLIVNRFSGDGVSLISGSGHTVQGCWIGLDATGSAAAANFIGVELFGGTGHIVSGNVISGNAHQGIDIGNSSGHVIIGNLVGLNVGGIAAVANGSHGIVLSASTASNIRIGGTAAGEGNVISGNAFHGINLATGGPNNVVQGNIIGLNAAGTAALLNNGNGILVAGSGSQTIGGTVPGARNLISGNAGAGILIQSSNNLVQGNWVGLNGAGTGPIPNRTTGVLLQPTGAVMQNNTIGGTDPGARNVISGNSGTGLLVSADVQGTTIQGNWIGLNAAGAGQVPNGAGGVRLLAGNTIVGGTAAGAGNVIAGNSGANIRLENAGGDRLFGNKFGTRPDGTGGIQNNGANVLIDVSNTTVGGTGPGEGNLIALAGGAGVSVNSGTGSAIRGNSIHDNGGLGIELPPAGVNPNDPGDGDTGPNNLQNFPVLAAAGRAVSSTTVTGTLSSAPLTTFTLDFYASPAASPGGNEEGTTYLGSATVRTDSAGNVAFTITLGMAVPVGQVITATATDPGNNTSEFSRGVAVGTVVPQTLRVANFRPTATGFIATFNRPIEPTVLNLYDAEGANLGPADVTLTDAGGNPVRGSLIVDASGTRITFVRTGGVLPAGDTTVTLFSNSNAFKAQANGELLDGDADGTSGGDYRQTFTADSSTVVVSVPDFARVRAGQPVDVPATAAGLPLRLTSAGDVTSLDFTLRYDSTLLQVTGFAPGADLPADAQLSVDTGTAGVVHVVVTGSTALLSGTIELVRLTAAVPDTAPYGRKQVLDVGDLTANGGTLTALDDDGVHVAGYLGDASGNARISATDARLQALRRALGLDSGFASYRLADPVIVADITSNGRLDSLDATRILQEAVGLDQPEIPNLPANAPTIPASGPDPLLFLPKTFRGRPGETITVPLLLDRSEGLHSADLALSYDARRLELVEVRRGGLTADFDLFLVNPDAGTIRVGLGRSAGPVEDLGFGSVLEITFRIKPDAPAGRAIINLRRGLGQTITQLNEGGLDLNPDPRDRTGDLLDGVITVLPMPRRRVDEFFQQLGAAGLQPVDVAELLQKGVRNLFHGKGS